MGAVTLPLASSDTGEASITQTSLSFTPFNWSTAQTVTVTGVNDDLIDGDQTATISLGPATSTDPSYNGVKPAGVTVKNVDNDSAGFVVAGTNLTTTEGGSATSFTVKLSSQPVGKVVLDFTSGDTTEGTINPSSLTFTGTDWSTSQTVTPVDDTILDGDISYSVTGKINSSSTTDTSGYKTALFTAVSVTNKDNEPPITSFVFTDATNPGSWGSDITATVSGTAVTVLIPVGTALTSLTPTLVLASGATISPTSGTARNFSSNQTYIVTDTNGGTTTFIVSLLGQIAVLDTGQTTCYGAVNTTITCPAANANLAQDGSYNTVNQPSYTVLMQVGAFASDGSRRNTSAWGGRFEVFGGQATSGALVLKPTVSRKKSRFTCTRDFHKKRLASSEGQIDQAKNLFWADH